MRRNKKLLIALVGVIGILIGATGIYYGTTKFGWFSQTIVNKLEKEVTVNESGIADAVEKLYDSVVVIGAYKDEKLASSGTGFVYKVDNKKAYIITNAHVISSSNSVKVKFTDNKVMEVDVVGQDEYADIAVLSVASDKIISVAEIGSSEIARLGDTLFTIGAPLDTEYSWTVTRGILSGKDRLVEVGTGNSGVANWVMSVMQTDAAINSGNSGGPIANSNGEVIGVTNMKLVSSGVEGIGFAIPIEDAIHYADQLIENKEIIRPVLGVGTLNVTDTESLRFQYGISIDSSITSGAVVAYVQAGSPAAESGLDKGDVITKFGDYEITTSAKLRYYLYKYNLGDKVKLTYLRGTKEQTITIHLNEKAG